MSKKRGLGRNLNALLGSAVQLAAPQTVTNLAHDLREIPLDHIQRGQYQPREHMDPVALGELTASIKTQGVIQPILLRPKGNERYEIVAGERRWQAAQRAGLTHIPAVIKEMPDQTALAVALIENIQRQNLNPIEEAKALLRLKQEFDMTDQVAAEAVGRQRSSVTNLLRLLSLNAKVQALLQEGQISMGHARALLSLSKEQQWTLATAIVAQRLSVRQTEQSVQDFLKEPVVSELKSSASHDPNIVHLERKLSEQLGTAVSLQANAKGRGKLVIPFNNLDQLQGVLDHLATDAVD